MPAPLNLLPVYGVGDTFLGHVSCSAAQRMLAAGSVVPRGTKHRIRALIATHENFELLASERPPTNQKYSHNRETRDNPQGVWTFKKIAR
jgi:hypothetical protein